MDEKEKKIEEATKELAAATNELAAGMNKTQSAEKPKKSKKGLIIGVSAGAVLILGGAGVAYALTNTPENVALSAISNFLNTTNRSVNGTFSVEVLKKNSSFPLESASITLKTDMNSDNENATTAELKVVYDDEEYSVSLGAVVIKDYTVYVSVDGIKEATTKLMDNIFNSGSSSYLGIYEDLINQIAEEVDGTWWKISVPDLIDTVDATVSEKSKMKEVYSCVVDAIDKIDGSKYAEIYKKNAFVSIEKYTGSNKFSGKGTPYTVSIDADKYVSFVNTAIDEMDGLGINDCIESANGIGGISTSYEVEKIDKAEAKEMIEELPDMIATIDGLFSHELTGIYMTKEDRTYSGKVDLTFSKLGHKIEAPADSKPATELYTNIMGVIEDFNDTAECRYMKEYYPSYFERACDANYHLKESSGVQPTINV